jgi:hypothetical protein
VSPRRIPLVCRRCRKPLDTLEWLETEGRLALRGVPVRRGRALCWWDHRPDGADQPPTRLRYICGGRHRDTAGIVAMPALTDAYRKAVAQGEPEILLPL